jgi:hypothetical protein
VLYVALEILKRKLYMLDITQFYELKALMFITEVKKVAVFFTALTSQSQAHFMWKLKNNIERKYYYFS